MSTREQLEQAIAVQENLRGVIDDAILDATLTALRRQLAELEPVADQRRAVATVLFADLAGHTALMQGRDPEEIDEIIDPALQRLGQSVARFGGRVVRYQGDGFKAVFGLPTAEENDPDNAIRAGLDILSTGAEIAAELAAQRGLPGFRVRVGIDTGPVLLGGGTEGEDAVAGLPVNLAARLETAAEPDTVLISHNTYQHVRGVFDVTPLEPVIAKGFPDPVPVYRVLRAKARSFRTRRRGVEGVETRMIGRDAELDALRELFNRAVAGERQSAVVVGEAGLGKSRLLYEFENWVDLQPINVQLHRSRARLETRLLPYGLLRDVFVFRCGIHDDDPPPVVRQKIVLAFEQALGAGEAAERPAHLVGHLLGYDFSASPHIRPLLGDVRQLRSQALHQLNEYFRAAAARLPVLLLFEDLHWADDSSLDAIAALAIALADRPAMLLGAARPSLYERRPDWMADRSFHRRIDLSLLGEEASVELVAEILKQAEHVPDQLRDLIVSRAEGNPFYVEELIKMLLDEGVIVKGEDNWHIRVEKLAESHVPPTLTGVLQARLESLPTAERAALQRASVVGRQFWDTAVEYIESAPLGATAGVWPALRRRELVYVREETAFEGTHEYVFKHALLRDVTYESVLRRVRRNYHRRAAEWLIATSGDRADEYADQIAAHFAAAGDSSGEAQWQTRAGLAAARRYAAPEAVRALTRALELTPLGELAARYELLTTLHEIHHLLADRAQEALELDELERLAVTLNDDAKQAKVATERSRYYLSTGAFDQCVDEASRGLELARRAGEVTIQARAEAYRGNGLMFLGDYEGSRQGLLRAVELAESVDEKQVQAAAIRTLGILAEEQGDFASQNQYYERALALAREQGDRVGERRALNSLGVAAQNTGAYELANTYFDQSLAIARQIGDRIGEGTVLGNLGVQANNLGDYGVARRYFEEALRIARATDDRTGVNIAQLNLGGILANVRDIDGALAFYEDALRGAEDTGDRPLISYMLNGSGCALYLGGRIEEAEDVLRRALDLRLELGQPHLAAETKAFLSEVLAAAGEHQAAVAEAGEALAFLDTGHLEDAEDEQRALLSIYHALNSAGDPRAGAALVRAYSRLQSSAARLDEASRRRYLENVAWNREIAALWLARQAGADRPDERPAAGDPA